MNAISAAAVPIAAPCLLCGTTGGYILKGRPRPFRGRGLCKTCYRREDDGGRLATWPIQHPLMAAVARRVVPELPARPPAVVRPAMVGIRPGQPPTDPRLTRRRVWEIGTLNARAALLWLHRYPALATAEAWATLAGGPLPPATAPAAEEAA